MESRTTPVRTQFAQRAWWPLAVLACAIALVASLSVSTQTAWAGGGGALEDIYSGTVKTTVVANPPNSYFNNIFYYSQKNASKKPTAVRSSNTNVLTAEVRTVKGYSTPDYTSPDYYPLVISLKKAGTSTVTFKHAGKAHKVKFVVSNYENPVKSLKVGGKDYTSSFDSKNLAARSNAQMYSTTASTNATGKVVVKPKSGWKLCGLTSGLKKLRNGASKTSAWNLDVALKSKKTGVIEKFHLQQPLPTYAPHSASSSLRAGAAAL